MAAMQSYLQNLSGNQLTDFNTGSVLNSILDTVAAELENIYNENYQVYLASYIATATGNDLDNKASDFGLTRLIAEYSSGYLLFGRTSTSNEDIVIPISTIATTATSSTANAIQFETSEYAVLPAGGLSVRVAAVARTAGANGNVDVSSIVVLSNPPSGIEYVTNASTFSGGNDEETDKDLRNRIPAYLNGLQRGTKDAIEYAAKTIIGVVDAYVEENSPTLGYAYCWVADSTGTASNQLLSAVQTVIDEYKPLGTTVTARAPIVHPIDVEMWVTLSSGYSFSAVQASLEAILTEYFNAKKIGEDVYRSEFINLIQGVNGVSRINTNTETLASGTYTCDTDIIQNELHTTTDKSTVETDYNCYSVQGVYLSSDTLKTGTNYSQSWDREIVTTYDVPIENEYHIPDSISQVSTTYFIDSVVGVYTDTTKTGTNYYLPSGTSSAGGTTVYLGTNLPSASTPVYVEYVEYDLGSNTNTAVNIDYTRQKVEVTNTIAEVKGVYADTDTAKENDYYFGGNFSDKTIYLGKAFSNNAQIVVVDYWAEANSQGLKPYYDVSVANSSTARARIITIHQIS